MSAKFESLVKALSDVIKSPTKDTEPFDTVATVTRIDGDTAFVHMPGGVAETPVSLTISCKEGDSVQVRVGGGKAWLVGNASAPPTDDTTANTAIRKTGVLGDQLTKVQKIAGNTNQYFWHTETGEDTGSHITEIPQERFLASPGNGGGNLLLRSNGIAIRNGLSELATFSSTAIQFNQPGTNTVVATIGTSGLYIQKGVIKIGSKTSASDTSHTGFYVDGSGNVAASNLLATGGKIGGWEVTSGLFRAYGDENGASTAANALSYVYIQSVPGTNGGNVAFGVRARTAAERTAGQDIHSSTPQCYINHNGYFYARNANIQGTITATSGTIGGWLISASDLYRTNGSSTLHLNGDGLQIHTGSYNSNYGIGELSLSSASGVIEISTSRIRTETSSGFINIYPYGVIELERVNGASYISVATMGYKIAFDATTSGNRGIYDSGLGRWMLYNDSSNNLLLGHPNAPITRIHGTQTQMMNAQDAYVKFLYDSNSHHVFQPSANGSFYMGTSTLRWGHVYCTDAAWNGSDLKQKSVIEDFDWKVDEFIAGLKPIAYKRIWEDGSLSTRIRLGFGAQDVAKLSKDLDMGDLCMYNAVIVDEDENGEKTERDYHGEDIDDSKLSWSLGYTELIAPMVLEIQQLMNRVSELEARLNG